MGLCVAILSPFCCLDDKGGEVVGVVFSWLEILLFAFCLCGCELLAYARETLAFILNLMQWSYRAYYVVYYVSHDIFSPHHFMRSRHEINIISL